MEETTPKVLFKNLTKSEGDYLHLINIDINNNDFKATGTFFIPKDISCHGNCKLYLNNSLVEGKVNILPSFISFFVGVLNVTNVYSQEHYYENIPKFILENLKKLQISDRDLYTKIYTMYREFFKEAILDSNHKTYHELLIDLIEFNSNTGEILTFNEYQRNLQEDQKEIFYLAGERIEELYNSPYLERVNDNEICVLLLLDMIDEYLLRKIRSYKNMIFMDITREDLQIIIDDKQSIDDFTEIEPFYACVKRDLHKLLDNSVEEVRLSLRLVESPAILLTKRNGISPNMERIMRTKHSFDDCCERIEKRVLEINPNNILIHALYELHDESLEAFNNMAKLLFQTTLIRCGVPLYRPMEFTNTVYSLMGFCLDIKEEFAKDPDEIEFQLPSSKDSDTSGGGVGVESSSS